VMICLLLLWQREFYNLRALVCKLFWKGLSFAMKLEVFFSPFSEFLEVLLLSLLLLLSSFFPSLSLCLSVCVRQESVVVRNPRSSNEEEEEIEI